MVGAKEKSFVYANSEPDSLIPADTLLEYSLNVIDGLFDRLVRCYQVPARHSSGRISPALGRSRTQPRICTSCQCAPSPDDCDAADAAPLTNTERLPGTRRWSFVQVAGSLGTP
jgi:hypothetical protein